MADDDVYVIWLGGRGALRFGTKSISSSLMSVDIVLPYDDLFVLWRRFVFGNEMYFDAYAHSLRSLKYIIDDWNYLSVSVDGIEAPK